MEKELQAIEVNYKNKKRYNTAKYPKRQREKSKNLCPECVRNGIFSTFTKKRAKRNYNRKKYVFLVAFIRCFRWYLLDENGKQRLHY